MQKYNIFSIRQVLFIPHGYYTRTYQPFSPACQSLRLAGGNRHPDPIPVHLNAYSIITFHLFTRKNEETK